MKSVFSKYTDEKTFERIKDYESVSEMWGSAVKEFGDATAITEAERSITYTALESSVSLMRGALIAKGLKKGDRVGIYIPNSIEFAVSYLAVTTLGMVAVLLPPTLDEMTVFGCSMKFALKGIVFSESISDKLSIVKAKNPALPLITDTETGEATKACKISGDDPCTVLFTGGTTGKSKGALLSNKATMRGTKNGCYGIKDIFGEKYLLVLPLTHVFGLIRNLLTSIFTGSNIFICKDNKQMFRDIAMFQPTVMVMVPALVEMALKLSKQFGRNMFGPSIKTIICGASAVSPYLISEAKKLGITLLPGYGLTESANLVSGNPEAEKNPSSVGFIYDGIDYKIVDGELWLKGINMMDGYIGEPEENELSYEDGWFKTGDLVRMDDEGFLYITGRKKEIIVLSNGENVSPAEIETRFLEITEIQDCLVYENNDKLTLEVLPRFEVIKALGIEDGDAHLRERINALNRTLPSYQRINEIVIRETDFIRSPSMKIVRGQNGKK